MILQFEDVVAYRIYTVADHLQIPGDKIVLRNLHGVDYAYAL